MEKLLGLLRDWLKTPGRSHEAAFFCALQKLLHKRVGYALKSRPEEWDEVVDRISDSVFFQLVPKIRTGELPLPYFPKFLKNLISWKIASARRPSCLIQEIPQDLEFSHGFSPEIQFFRIQGVSAVQEALGTLHPGDKQIAEEVFLQGNPPRVLAQILGIPVQKVYKAQDRIRTRLRKSLGAWNPGQGALPEAC